MFVFDTETRTDKSQRLTFGSYRFFVDHELCEEGLFYANDLPRKDLRTLQEYVAAENRTPRTRLSRLLLLTRRQFLKKFYKAVYKGRALLVGFNLPFDLSRIAIAARPARGRFAGGFSLALWLCGSSDTGYSRVKCTQRCVRGCECADSQLRTT
jgi:hypothetical protein